MAVLLLVGRGLGRSPAADAADGDGRPDLGGGAGGDGGTADLRQRARSGSSRCWRRSAGRPTAFHQPAWAGLLPETVPDEIAAAGQRAAPPGVERRARRRPGDRRHPGRDRRRGLGDPRRRRVVPGRRGGALADGASAVTTRLTPSRSGFREDLARGWAEVRSRRWLMAMILDTGLWVLVDLGAVLGARADRRQPRPRRRVVVGGDHRPRTGWGRSPAARPGCACTRGGRCSWPWSSTRRSRRCWRCWRCRRRPGGSRVAAVPAGAAVSLYLVLWDTTVQQRVPREALARVASYERAATFALMPVGMALAGPVAARLGVPETLWISVGWLGVSTVFLLCMPSVRRAGAAQLVGAGLNSSDRERGSARTSSTATRLGRAAARGSACRRARTGGSAIWMTVPRAVLLERRRLEPLADAVLEHPRLHQVDHGVLDPAAPSLRLGHRLRQPLQRVAVAAADQQVEHVAVGQAAQRRGGVRVAGGDAGVDRRPPAARRRRTGRRRGPSRRAPPRGCAASRGRDGSSRSTKSRYGSSSGHSTCSPCATRRSRVSRYSSTPPITRSRPKPRCGHQVGGGHPGQQRDLGVPVLGLDARLQLEPVAAAATRGRRRPSARARSG